MEGIGYEVGSQSILATCDRSGMSQKGYTSIYKIMENRMKHVDKNIRLRHMMNPHQVKLA
jgi:hypothetical protein